MPYDSFLDRNGNRVVEGDRVIIYSGVGTGDVCRVVKGKYYKTVHLIVEQRGPANWGRDTWVKNHYRVELYDYMLDIGL